MATTSTVVGVLGAGWLFKPEAGVTYRLPRGDYTVALTRYGVSGIVGASFTTAPPLETSGSWVRGTRTNITDVTFTDNLGFVTIIPAARNNRSPLSP